MGQAEKIIKYFAALNHLKLKYEQNELPLDICNNALVSIAKELGVLNPVLL